MRISIQQINSVLGSALLTAIPVLLLTEIGHASSAWYALVLSSLVMWFTREGGLKATLTGLRPYRVLASALAYCLLPTLLFMSLHRTGAGAELERATRMLFGCLFVLGAVLSMKPQWLRQASWGFVFAGLASSAYVFWPAERVLGRPVTPEYNAVSYGNLMLLITVLLLYSTRWQLTSWSRAEKAIKWVTVGITLIAFVFTETRTGWLALPVFGVIWIYLNGWVKRLATMMYVAIGLIAVCTTLILCIPKMHQRITDGVNEVSECLTTNSTAFTSTCVRVQLWRSSMDMFVENPILGLGLRKNFQPELQLRVSKGLVSQRVAEGWAESHSDMMMVLATQGVLGGLGLLLVYFAPAFLFARRLSLGRDNNARVAAAMGLAICLGFAVFGLTELMFRGMRTVGFYAVMIGWLMALSDPEFNAEDLRAKV